MARHILVLANRRKLVGKKQRLVQDVMDGLTAIGHEVTLSEVTPSTGNLDLDPTISGQRFEQVVVAGGDGTLNRVLQDWTRPETPLALIPLGTLNLVARECGYPRTAPELTRIIDACRWRNFFTASADDQVFAIGAGCGIDSFLMSSVDRSAKQRFGRPYLVWRTVRALWQYRWPDFDVRINGEPAAATSLCLLKGRYYGGPFTFTRRAAMFEPSLHVALAGRQRLRRTLGIAAFVCRIPWLAEKMFTVVPVRELDIRGPAGFPFHVDGDVRLELPVRVVLHERPLRICVP
jgi:diacylglycerol kinase (ATP)